MPYTLCKFCFVVSVATKFSKHLIQAQSMDNIDIIFDELKRNEIVKQTLSFHIHNDH
jgi:hypothetical protein